MLKYCLLDTKHYIESFIRLCSIHAMSGTITRMNIYIDKEMINIFVSLSIKCWITSNPSDHRWLGLGQLRKRKSASSSLNSLFSFHRQRHFPWALLCTKILMQLLTTWIQELLVEIPNGNHIIDDFREHLALSKPSWMYSIQRLQIAMSILDETAESKLS